MNNDMINGEQCLQNARILVQHLESENYDDAEKTLSDLTHIQETEMYQELGKLTRELHNTLSGFRVDSRIENLAEQGIPDAKERLNFVIQITDQAAHKTLAAVEESIPVCDEIVKSTGDINEKWKKFTSRDMSADQFREMAREIGKYLESSSDKTATLRESLNDIMMAQEYQDLSGQTIRRVINLVQEMEESLIGIIRISSRHSNEESDKTNKSQTGLQGPQMPGMEDEVDDLLSSLGFLGKGDVIF